MATLVEPVFSTSAEILPDTCSLDNYLAMPDHTMDDRIAAARARLGKDALILGHHYQRDEVIRFADFTGDSYKLSKIAAESSGRYILFCGVHFMAESADILARPYQQVILPDLNAGCSMADMADISQVEECWSKLVAAGLDKADSGGLIPLTYMNSTAAIKAFCGERGGLVCTSSNAKAAFEWAFAQGTACAVSARPAPGPQHRIRHGDSAVGNRGVGSVPDQRRTDAGATALGANHLMERALLGASALSAGTCGQSARDLSGYPGDRASGVPAGGLPEGGRNRVDGTADKDY